MQVTEEEVPAQKNSSPSYSINLAQADSVINVKPTDGSAVTLNPTFVGSIADEWDLNADCRPAASAAVNSFDEDTGEVEIVQRASFGENNKLCELKVLQKDTTNELASVEFTIDGVPAEGGNPAGAPFGGGTGTGADPYLICSRSHLGVPLRL